jgi:uncharacterized protein YbbC (DUF1343 family)
VPVGFTPKSSNEKCGGVNIVITDRGVFRPVPTGVDIAYQVNLRPPGFEG